MENPMKTHIQVIAWINILFGIPGLLFGAMIALGVSLSGIAFLPALPFTVGLGILIIAYAALGVIFGMGLLQGAPWARILGIIVNIINLINVGTVGVSTIFGIYSLVILFHPKTERLFDRGY
jgi:hypothetical protein